MIPGILNLVIDVAPRVISLETLLELASAKAPRIRLFPPLVRSSPAPLPKEVLLVPVAPLKESNPTPVLPLPVAFCPESFPIYTQ